MDNKSIEKNANSFFTTWQKEVQIYESKTPWQDLILR